MDEFLEGLASRLRVFGMVADSIMMKIVNTRMEEAYRKVCSMEGGLEQLNQKSHFCELAVMQLDWCLNFIEEEMDHNPMVGSNLEHEELVADLKETRERINGRLEETELAIKEKDEELDQRAQNELNLRQALDSKGDEMRSFISSLENERMKSVKAWEFSLKSQFEEVSHDGSRDFDELQKSVEQQLHTSKEKLADELEAEKVEEMRENLQRLDEEPAQEATICSLMNNSKIFDTMTFRVSTEDHKDIILENKHGETEDLKIFSITELKMVFDQMKREVDVLKNMLEVAFHMTEGSVGFCKLRLEEQLWRQTIEQEIVGTVTKSFLAGIKENYEANYCTKCTNFAGDCFLLIDKMKNFRNDLVLVEKNTSEIEVFAGRHESSTSSKLESGNKALPLQSSIQTIWQGDTSGIADPLQRSEKSDSFVAHEEICHQEHSTPDERLDQESCCVAEIVRNHESIIKKKTEEVHSFVNGEKRNSISRKGKKVDANIMPKCQYDTKTKMLEIISKCQNVIEEAESLAARAIFHENEEEKVNCENTCADSNGGCRDFMHDGIESCIREQIYLAVMKETINDMKSSVHVVTCPGNLQKVVSINSNNFVPVMVEQTSQDEHCPAANSVSSDLVESNAKCLHGGEAETTLENERIENFISERINREVFAGAIKSIQSAIMAQNELGKNVEEKESTLQIYQPSELLNNGEGFSSEGNKSGQVSAKLNDRREDLQISIQHCKENCDESTSIVNNAQEKEHSSSSQDNKKEADVEEQMVKPVLDFMKKVTDFELSMQEKLTHNIARYDHETFSSFSSDALFV